VLRAGLAVPTLPRSFGADVQRAGFLAVPLRRAELEAAYSYNECDRLLLGSQSINKQRWKSPNNSVGGGLSYLGDDIALYRRWYEIKGKDDTVAWRKLIHVTKVLTETPAEQLEQALAPIMDVDAVLRFLALDVALVNGGGYWKDGSDFNLYLNPQGRFSLLPHDVNEGLRTGGRSGGAAIRLRRLMIRTRHCGTSCSLCPRCEPGISRTSATSPRSGWIGSGSGRWSSATFAELRRAALLAHPEIVKARGR
jgi:hypothetical protein